MQKTPQSVLVAVVALIAMIKFVSHASHSRRNKPIRAPAWAKHLWHIVPEPLLHSLTHNDWIGIRAMNEARIRQFVEDDRVLAFKKSHRIVLSLTTSP